MLASIYFPSTFHDLKSRQWSTNQNKTQMYSRGPTLIGLCENVAKVEA